MDLFSIFYPHRQWENPDILSCLANISYDEVFTPPAVAVRMLDILPAEIWYDPDATFLDPACKSGVFLREIAKRLFAGLADQIPDEQERITHILHHQIYGIAVTELTGLVTRRTLYCTKYAYAPVRYNLAPFDNVNGNVIFHHLPHRWVNGRCTFCGTSADVYNRPRWLENYAYEFIHTAKAIITNGMRAI